MKWVSVRFASPASTPLSGNSPRPSCGEAAPPLFPHAVQVNLTPPLIFRCWHSALGLFLEFQERGLLLPLGLPGEWDVKLELLRPSCPQRERLPEKEDSTEKHRARGGDCAFQELSGFLDAAELEAVHFRSFYAPAH